MTLNPYLLFNGECAAAFKFYEKCFGGKIEMSMTYGEIPAGEPAAENTRNLIAHVRMVIDGMVLMGGDAPPERYQKPAGFSVSLNVDRASEAERIFAALADGGSIGMPLQSTFWAERFGMVTDRFGSPWMVSFAKPA